jgi:hypothetical protein
MVVFTGPGKWSSDVFFSRQVLSKEQKIKI